MANKKRNTPAKTQKKPAAQGKAKPTGAKRVIKVILLSLLFLGCFCAMLGSVLAIKAVKYVVETTQSDNIVLDLERMAYSQTGHVWATDPETGEQIVYQELIGEQKSEWIAFKDIPQTMIDAVISVEDRKFYNHKGVDIPRTIYAGLNSVFHFKSSNFGASTIDQQLIKNLTGDNEVDKMRKLREIFRAWGLNNNYSKDMIMEAYLNTLPLSGMIVGVQTGAREYFNKDLNECTLPEFALIAGITKAPGSYNPFVNPENALTRRNVVLKMMLDNEKIAQAEYDWAKQQPLGLNPPEKTPQQEAAAKVNDYFMDELYTEVTKDFIDAGIVETQQEAYYLYYNGGINIYATVNPYVQKTLEEIYALPHGSEGSPFPEMSEIYRYTDENGEEQEEEEFTQSAMAVLNIEDGSVAGLVGGVGEKQASLVLNRSTAARPVGSTIKPIGVYALGIDYGITHYSQMLYDSPIASRNPQNPTRNPETGEIIFDWPYNVNEKQANNVYVNVADAVAQSYNTIAARVGSYVGVDNIFDFLEDSLMISTLSENDRAMSPMFLGSLTYGISPLELAAAYAMFGNGGVYNEPYLYYSVTDAYGNLLLRPDSASMQAISEESAFILNQLLRNVLRSSGPVSGSAKGMALSYLDSAGKSGTTDDLRDLWFAGVTPYYSAAVWYGYDHNMEMTKPPRGPKSPPLVAWKTALEAIQENLPEKTFPEKPADVLEANFCRETGLLQGPLCTNLQIGYYQPNYIPDTCGAHSAEEAPAA